MEALKKNNLQNGRLTLVTHEVKEMQHAYASSSLHHHYSELFIFGSALKLANIVTKLPYMHL